MMNEERGQGLLHERLSRRRLLRIAGGLVLASVVDLRLPGQTGAAATRMRWVERDLFPESGVYQSPVFTADQPFNSLELIWRAARPDAVSLAVRVSEDGAAWTRWLPVHHDTHVRSLEDERTFGVPVLIERGRHVQYRAELLADAGTPPVGLHEVEVGCVDTSAPAQWLDAAAAPLIDGWIIPRAGWGADESLRYSNGAEIWPPEYRPVQKVIIHHTVTENEEADPAASVRAIYYYHAITQGWGDIGYNFLIDWHGNVYEGRYGGANVVAGHALQYNWGSMGIALLGSFDAADASDAALDALVHLITTRAANVDPAGIGYFIDTPDVPNICGHRDVLSTACPGGHLYDRIPEIRGRCKGTGPIYLGGGSGGPTSAELVSFTVSPTTLYSGLTLRIEAVVRNTGGATIGTQGPPSGFVYEEGQTFDSAGFPKIEGLYRVGVDFDGNAGVPNPFRWGLPGPLEPGAEATAVGYVRLKSQRRWTFSGSLVQEFVRYWGEGVSPQQIEVLPPPTAPTAQSADPSLRYEAATQHNVPTVFYDYWSANGGLERFGYPLTEPYEERSETDGGTYLTQYFERARFEHHAENAGTPYDVLLGLLGRERTRGRENEPPFRRLGPLPASNDYLYFPETGHTLRAGFRWYWENNGGLPVFGYPISEEFDEVSKTDGQRHVVQYFERARFEWHPDLRGTPYEFLLGHLGREVLIDRGWLPGAP